ncbi:SGNH/GDSL hydrolase family protein [Bradyrhizobium sp. 76]|uniref:SGNH/GDSL hydrolase family protein n=1 Tax=Bradyrhizobium sp. 76 TaxID=2782680 RepID=UPI001FFB7233|nr:SGNH/GDSL hydrolase family protein [Bradyrhizobium sp. 76]MCK1406659.1 SGNH/GDSL hydrolase family protein [Bradyrhizobium sp. 76]
MIQKLVRKLTSIGWRGHLHLDIRRQMIGFHLEQAGAGSILVCGDSRVEAAFLPSSIAGTPVVNAGIGGATISLIGEEVARIIAIHRVRLLVLSAGVNDAKIENRTTNSVSDFRNNLETVIKKLAPNAECIMLTSIPPVEKGKLLGSRFYDGDLICKFNNEIAACAERNGLDFFDLARPMMNESRELAASLSIDGVHLNRFGYGMWRPALISAIERSLDVAACR